MCPYTQPAPGRPRSTETGTSGRTLNAHTSFANARTDVESELFRIATDRHEHRPV